MAAGGAVALSGGFATPVTKNSHRRVRIAEIKIRETSAPARAKGPRLGVLFPGAGYADRGGSRLVRSLQRRLARAGDHPGPIDGLYGPLTEEAVIDFQAADGLKVDGIAGPQTLSALRQPVLYPGAGYGTAGGSSSVRTLQRRLITAGYKPGPVDGLYGPRTEHAVVRFQAAHRLRIDGIAGRQTFAALRVRRPGAQRARRNARRSAKPAAHRPSARPRSALLSVSAPRRKVPRSSVYDFTLALAAALAVALLLLALVALFRRPWSRKSTPAPVPSSTSADVRTVIPAPVRVATPGHVTPRNPGPDESNPGPDESTPAPAESAPAPVRAAPRARSTSRFGEIAFERGTALETRGDLEGAAAAFLQADRVGHGRAAYRLGILLEEQGELTGAEGAFRRAAQRGDSNGALSLASLLEEHGAVQQAIIAYERAAQLGNAKAAAHLGALRKRREDSDRAEVGSQRAGEREDFGAQPSAPKLGAVTSNGTQVPAARRG